ncbi:4-hydroxythreonine-4-phosphate dehydrogenase PdxA [Rubinisphaera margarita]|uniref:4-hydroxythreonine-4-phosphate dehydrogenase PdxA n=1 Tax=Rubinisphaera margarita TaxID=2909586 RepID=UPI001EE82714|nr:4-hydroxythreonine-4-phosphate dehydrogenase PdxA [Rubinisphaera margarita]MCG6154564.1 4-hydroxythreonine-4-phosphate dehydrogenase PdxA [Rubinisphaera margarita]
MPPSDQNIDVKPVPRLAITMGDPAGIGPELCLQLLNREDVALRCQPLMFGDPALLRRVSDRLTRERGPQFQLSAPILSWAELQNGEQLDSGPAVIDLTLPETAEIPPGEVSAAAGRAAFHYLDRAIDACLQGFTSAVVTGPLHKEALHAAGYHYPGHTEILAEKTQAEPIVMMLTSPEITCSLVTTHIGYRDVIEELTTERICETIQLTHDAMQRMRGRAPRLTVCGLNPHAGEHGLFGQQEEERIIQPAIDWARERRFEITGPLPPDTAFVPRKREQTDAYICMYHDQGLIPLKALSFDDAVNVTLGLPIVRTSVDHGTAFDIAWQGIAEVNSLVQAVDLAILLQSNPASGS